MNDIEIVKRELKKRSQGDSFFSEVCHIAIGYIDNLENTIKEKQKHLENLEKVNEELEERIAIMSEGGWIPVKKQLPEKKETVLLADKYEICFGYLTDYEDFRAVDDCLTEDNRPARQKYPCSCYEYWMHLPELPKGWALDDEPPKDGEAE